MKTIELLISPKGEVRLESFGYKGKACMDVDKILKGLSNKINETKKSEYFINEQPNDVTIVGSN